jgi:hypothetical protein
LGPTRIRTVIHPELSACLSDAWADLTPSLDFTLDQFSDVGLYRRLACELRDDGAWGVDVQVYREGELLYGRRWNPRLALAEAEERKTGKV